MSGGEPTIEIKECYDLSVREQKEKFYEAIGTNDDEIDLNDIKTLYGIPTTLGIDQKIYEVKIKNIPYEDLDPGEIEELITGSTEKIEAYKRWYESQGYNEIQSLLPIPKKKYAISQKLQPKICYYDSSFPEYLTQTNIRKKLTELYATHDILKKRYPRRT